MAKKLLTLLFMAVLAFPMGVFAQDAMKADAPMKGGKEAKWEGNVVRTSADKSTLTVRNGSGVEMTIIVRQLDALGQPISRQQDGQRN